MIMAVLNLLIITRGSNFIPGTGRYE